MLQEADAERIEALKKRIKARTKIEVVRTALDLLERSTERTDRVRRWERAVALAARESLAVGRELRSQTRLKRVE
jgi:hypothetical protein